jgi:hypothetical protein
MQGLGTSEGVLLEIICTRSPLEIATIKETYKRSVHVVLHPGLSLTDVVLTRLYDRVLEDDIMSETGGSHKRLMVSLLAGGRDQSTQVDQTKAESVCNAHSCWWPDLSAM